MRSMKRPYQITGAVLLLFGIFMARESLLLRFSTSLGPGPGFFPLLASVLVGLLGTIMLFQATLGVSDLMASDFFPSVAGYLRVVAIIVALIMVTILMNPLGFRLAMLAFLVFLLLALGRQGLVTTALVALVGSFGTYYVFVERLMVPLPTGMFGF